MSRQEIHQQMANEIGQAWEDEFTESQEYGS